MAIQHGTNREDVESCEGQYPDSKVHWANMGPFWGRKDPGGPQAGPMNFAIWVGGHTDTTQKFSRKGREDVGVHNSTRPSDTFTDQ